MAEEGVDRRFVERHPVLDPVAKARREQRGIVGEPLHDLRVGEPPAILECQGQVPVEQVDQWLDASLEEAVDEAPIEVEPGLIDAAGPQGQDARPADAEAVGPDAGLGHQPDVIPVAMVVVAGDVTGGAIGDRHRLAGELVPDGLGAAIVSAAPSI